MSLLLLLSPWASAAWAQADYAYSSENFDEVDGAYTTAMNVTAGLVLSAELPPNLPSGTDISAQVVSYSFNDGVQTLTQDNSYIVIMRVGTDSFCRITTWSMTVWQGANPVSGIDARYTPGIFDDSQDGGFIDALCNATDGGRCISNNVMYGPGGTATDSGLLSSIDPASPGTWTGPECPETPPADYAYSGENFVEVQGAYGTAMNVTAGLVLSTRLPPNLPPGTDISSQVVSYSFNDGVQTLDQFNSYVVLLEVSTDSFCRISAWAMTVFQGDNPVSGIDLSYSPGPPEDSKDGGFIDALCNSTDLGRCVSNNVMYGPGGTASDYGLVNAVDPATPGTWVGPECPEVPTVAYGYSSRNFSEVEGAYTTAMNVTGELILNAELPPNLPAGTDISGEVVNYRFSDGVQILTGDNSYIPNMTVGTDSFCRITSWAVTFWQGATRVSGIDARYTPGPPDDSQDGGFIDALCTATDNGQCVGTVGYGPEGTATDYGLLFSREPATPGTWTGPGCQVRAVPTADARGLILLILSLAICGGWMLFRRRPAAAMGSE